MLQRRSWSILSRKEQEDVKSASRQMSIIWYWKASISKWNLTMKAFLMHVLKPLEDRCSNNYTLFNSTGNEDNYFPLRSGIQHKLSADLTDFESGNCWPWPHLIRAAVSLFKREEYIEDSDFQEITLISLSAANRWAKKRVSEFHHQDYAQERQNSQVGWIHLTLLPHPEL